MNEIYYSLTDNKGIHLDKKLDILFNHKKEGFYIELGAFDGITQSNTYFFELNRNWKGLLIEPSKTSFDLCCKNRPNNIVVNCCCVSNDYKEDTILGDFNSTLMSSVNGERLHSYDLIEVKAMTLEKILDIIRIDSEIDFLSLDVEGYELHVLQGLNLDKYRPKYILIEIYHNTFNNILNYLQSKNYLMNSNFTNYNHNDSPIWDGTHNDFLFYDNFKISIETYNNIVTGEKIQQLCNIYFGFQEDFDFNPLIKKQFNKQFDLIHLKTEIDNPYYIFCYSHRINYLSSKIHLLKNKFILVTHNSDFNIEESEEVLHILNNNNLDKWYAQNLCFEHPKLKFIPIGIANNQWEHGKLDIFKDKNLYYYNKINNVYFNFNIHTNTDKRNICFNILKNKLEWLNNVSPQENIIRLNEYKFCICPEGNGVDTHRLWEALYLKTIPIVIKNEFTNILKKNGIPIIILNSWDEFDESKLIYDILLFENENYKKIINFRDDYLKCSNLQ